MQRVEKLRKAPLLLPFFAAQYKERTFQAVPYLQTPTRFPFFSINPSSSPVLYSQVSSSIFQLHHNLVASFRDLSIQNQPIMSMSMFSSFDALCAEKLGFSWSATPAAAVKVDDPKKSAKGEAVNSPPKAGKDRRTTRSPRFAVELDGVHCFETLVPY